MRKTCKVEIRCTPEEYATWKSNASAMGGSLSRWARLRLNGFLDEAYNPNYGRPASFVDRLRVAWKIVSKSGG